MMWWNRPSLDIVVAASWILLLSHGLFVNGQQCAAGQWGQDCQYQCHCDAAHCDVLTGVCDDRCDVGWLGGQGHTCQTQNIAFNKPSNFSADQTNKTPQAEVAVDGDRSNHGNSANTTCLLTPSGLKYVDWTVDLGTEHAIHDVLLVFRETDFSQIRGFTVSLYTENGTWKPCFEHTGSRAQEEFVVTCGGVKASRLRVANSRTANPAADLSQHAFLDLCEVEIYECSNGTYGPNCSQQCHCKSGGCDVTSGQCLLDTGQCLDGWTSDSCDQECPPGKYGAACSESCGHCEKDQPCHHISGACPGQCKAGFMHPQEGCQEACRAGRYGQNCAKNCGKCKDGAACNPASGNCPNGCQPGYHGNTCRPSGNADGEEGEGEDGLPTTAVVGAVAAGGTVFLCCVCAIAQIRKKRRKERNAKYKSDREAKRRESANMNNPIAAAMAASNAKAVKEERRKSSIFSSGRKMSLFGERKKSVVFAGGAERKKSIFAAVFGFARDEDLSGLPVYQNSTFTNSEASEGLFAQDKNAGEPVDRFRQYVYGKRRGTSSLENEFKAFPSGYTATCEDAERPENRDKNKFTDFYPYDFNRVVLRAWGHGDYINASHIKDYKGKDLYIAAQAPCKKSANDFWHMVWQENVGKIVMLTSFVENGKIKCDRYWSENGCVSYDDITVKDAAQTVRATYTIREMKLIHKKTRETRAVTHYQYTEWAEPAIPLVHDLLEFIWRVKAAPSDLRGPLLVHCSNGVGRTGTYIAVDSLLQQAEDTGRLDVKTYVELLRHQRKNMVLTKEQYAFVHAALIDGIILGDTRMPAAQFYEGFEHEKDHLRIGYRQICEQFHELSYLKSSMAFRRDSGIENINDLRNMNCDGITMQFVPSTLSSNMFRLVDVDEDTDTQKFMVLLRNIDAMTVVCVHSQDFQIFTRCLDWSQKHLAEVEERRKAREEAGNADDNDDDDDDDDDELYKMQELSSSELSPELKATEYRVYVDDYEEVTLELLSLSGWGQEERVFGDQLTTPIMTLADRIHNRQTQLGFHPVLVLVGEVQESAGLICVLTNIVHGIQLDDEVEVYSNVCRVRRLMPAIVTCMEEFLFCHQFAAKFANFQKAEFHI